MSEQDTEEQIADDLLEVEPETPVEEVAVEDETPNDDELARLREQNLKLFERAKKAEGFVKTPEGTWVKKQTTAPAPTQTTNAGLSRDEAILIAQGMDAEDLDELKVVAQAKGLSLLKAKETELFVGYLEKKQREERRAKASLSASKGSNSSQPAPIGELSKEDHMALVKKTMAELR